MGWCMCRFNSQILAKQQQLIVCGKKKRRYFMIRGERLVDNTDKQMQTIDDKS